MSMKCGYVLAGFLAFVSPAIASEDKTRSDVYYGACTEARAECEADWGRGNCRIPLGTMAQKIITSEVFFGDGSGGPDNIPMCVWVGPAYTARVKPVTKPVRMIVINARTKAIESFGWLNP